LCTDCWPAHRPTLELRSDRLARAAAAVAYEAPWDDWVLGLKFRAALELAQPMAALCVQAWQANADAPDTDGQSASAQAIPWAVVPVPLGPGRLRERGYNQAWELARRMARMLDLPALPNALLRLRDTRAQSELGRRERLANLAGALVAEPGVAGRLHGSRVLLVDDVWTTGATLTACAHALHAVGVSEVSACVFAATPLPAASAASAA
jgi:ComF family protein